jgi:hypothetical protein
MAPPKWGLKHFCFYEKDYFTCHGAEKLLIKGHVAYYGLTSIMKQSSREQHEVDEHINTFWVSKPGF